MDDESAKKPHSQARMIFLALVLLAFVWGGLFIALPALTGKPGIVQNMQTDLQKPDTDADR